VSKAGRTADLDKRCVSHLEDRLVRLGRAEKGVVLRRIHPRPRPCKLGAVTHSPDTLEQVAEPVPRDVVTRLNEASYPTVREGDSILFIFFREKIDCSRYLCYVIENSEPVPLRGGVGSRLVVLLAFASDELDEIVGRVQLVRPIKLAVTDRERLRRQVAEGCWEGYSVGYGEGLAGTLPCFLGNGTLDGSAVFSCPGVSLETHDHAEVGAAAVVVMMVGTARHLSARLSHCSLCTPEGGN